MFPAPPQPKQIWVTAIVLGHLFGIAFLVYSVERVNGSISRLARRAGLWKRGGRGVPDAQAGPCGDASPGSAKALAAASHPGGDPDLDDDDGAHIVRPPRWVRGCACKVRYAPAKLGRRGH